MIVAQTLLILPIILGLTMDAARENKKGFRCWQKRWEQMAPRR